MAMNSYGLSFQPGVETNGNGQGSGNGQQRANNVQTAIKLLSLRLPTQVSPSAIVPQELLQGQGSAALGGPGGEAAVQLVNRLMQLSQAVPPPLTPNNPSQSRSGGGSGSSAPAAPRQPEFVGDVPQPSMQQGYWDWNLGKWIGPAPSAEYTAQLNAPLEKNPWDYADKRVQQTGNWGIGQDLLAALLRQQPTPAPQVPSRNTPMPLNIQVENPYAQYGDLA